MKFIDRYPTMKPIIEEHNCIIRGCSMDKCCICHQPTEFIEINYEAYICSDECLNKMDNFYFEALKRAERSEN